MGVRGELFSTRVMLQNRTYFFNVKENRLGDLYLNIVESKNRDEGGFERQSVILFAEDLQEFLQGFDESLKVMEKAVREKRRGHPARASRDNEDTKDIKETEETGQTWRGDRKPAYGKSPAPRRDSRDSRDSRQRVSRDSRDSRQGASREGFRQGKRDGGRKDHWGEEPRRSNSRERPGRRGEEHSGRSQKPEDRYKDRDNSGPPRKRVIVRKH
jgi:hypothetical protein